VQLTSSTVDHPSHWSPYPHPGRPATPGGEESAVLSPEMKSQVNTNKSNFDGVAFRQIAGTRCGQISRQRCACGTIPESFDQFTLRGLQKGFRKDFSWVTTLPAAMVTLIVKKNYLSIAP
jgi:hypothetical protein